MSEKRKYNCDDDSAVREFEQKAIWNDKEELYRIEYAGPLDYDANGTNYYRLGSIVHVHNDHVTGGPDMKWLPDEHAKALKRLREDGEPPRSDDMLCTEEWSSFYGALKICSASYVVEINSAYGGLFIIMPTPLVHMIMDYVPFLIRYDFANMKHEEDDSCENYHVVYAKCAALVGFILE